MVDFIEKPWQGLMINHLMTIKRCALYADLGSGKTVSTLTALSDLALMGEKVYPALVLGPKRVVSSVWKQEAAKFSHLSHLKVRVLVGPKELRNSELRQPGDIYCVNYENLAWLCEMLGNNWPFKTIIADESTRIKGFRINQGTARAQILGKRAFHSERFWELTGTPAPNGLIDLWGQLYFLDKGHRLGRIFADFSDRWFYPSPDGRALIPQTFADEQIKDTISDICLTVNASDYMQIDKPINIIVPVVLPESAMRVYKVFKKELFAQLARGEVLARNAASKSVKCLQIANGCAYTTPVLVEGTTILAEGKQSEVVHDEKIEALHSIVEESSGSPLLVAYTFRCDMERILKAFPKARLLDDKQETIDAWNAGKIPMLLAHPKSCGHGLNLQDGGHRIVFFSLWWALEEYMQAIERVGPLRQLQSGYKRPVYVYHIIAAGTIEESVAERLQGKLNTQEALLASLKREIAS